MPTCKRVTELVTEYAEGNLSFLDRLRFQVHLGLCGHCRSYVHQMRVTARTLGKLPEPRLPDELRAEFVRRFETWWTRR